jgi:hypothetical protein
VGEALEATAKVAGGNLPTLWLIGLVGFFPLIAVRLMWRLYAGLPWHYRFVNDWPFVMGILGAFTVAGIQGPLCHLAAKSLDGLKPSPRECLARGAQRLWAVLLVSIFQVFDFLFLALFAQLILSFTGGSGWRYASAAAALVIILLGLVIALQLCLAVPASMIGRVGPLEAFRRARELSKGTLGRMFVVVMVPLSAGFLLAMLLYRLLPLVEKAGLPWAVIADSAATTVVVLPLLMAYCVLPVVFCQLRDAKEAASLFDEAKVFD